MSRLQARIREGRHRDWENEHVEVLKELKTRKEIEETGGNGGVREVAVVCVIFFFC